MRKFFIMMAMACTLFGVGCEKEFTPSAQLSTSFYDSYPNAVDVEWEWKHGRKYRVAEFKQNGMECEAWYTKSDEWVLTEYEMRYSELPEAVRTAFENSYGTMTPVDSVHYVDRSNGDDFYSIETEIIINDLFTEVYLIYSPNGVLLRTWAEIENYDYLYDYL
ncbi:MAG: PepSY-like domain-containing protein [Alistipes sp.]|nr:PepSY-like domain-containing protein [Alistipes sp.]